MRRSEEGRRIRLPFQRTGATGAGQDRRGHPLLSQNTSNFFLIELFWKRRCNPGKMKTENISAAGYGDGKFMDEEAQKKPGITAWFCRSDTIRRLSGHPYRHSLFLQILL